MMKAYTVDTVTGEWAEYASEENMELPTELAQKINTAVNEAVEAWKKQQAEGGKRYTIPTHWNPIQETVVKYTVTEPMVEYTISKLTRMLNKFHEKTVALEDENKRRQKELQDIKRCHFTVRAYKVFSVSGEDVIDVPAREVESSDLGLILNYFATEITKATERIQQLKACKFKVPAYKYVNQQGDLIAVPEDTIYYAVDISGKLERLTTYLTEATDARLQLTAQNEELKKEKFELEKDNQIRREQLMRFSDDIQDTLKKQIDGCVEVYFNAL